MNLPSEDRVCLARCLRGVVTACYHGKVLQWRGHTPGCSAVSLIPFGDTNCAKSSTSNCMASFQICQTGPDSEGLVLLAIATCTVTAICSKPACPLAANTGTSTTRSPRVNIHKHSDEGRWSSIHQRTLSL